MEWNLNNMISFFARDYLDRTAEEINEALQETGQAVIADAAKTFKLPTDFMLEVLNSSNP